MQETLLSTAQKVLTLEAEGLLQTSKILGDDFLRAIEIIYTLKGRLIISGMGKSGHVGAKIAATLASTGTPAFFIHPAEASHGDLGMITEHDGVLCLSNSGETAELNDLVLHTRRYRIPLLAIVARRESFLGRNADVALTIAPVAEACPHGLAPTTSTTSMLGLGDALAVSLIEKRGFTASDFRTFHPGGKLGARLLTVKDLMHQGEKLPLVHLHTPLSDVLLTMTQKSFGCAGIMDEDGHFSGMITDGDLRRHMGDTLLQKKAYEIMNANPITIQETDLAAKALGIMEEKRITSLFVLRRDGETQKVVGILHVHDCLRAGIA